MAGNYDNTNRGALFKNDRKQKDGQPDYSGSINIDGRDFWLSGWLKTGQKGRFFSLAVKPKENRVDRVAQPARRPAMADDDIPF